MARGRVTEIPTEVIQALQADVRDISHGTVVIESADSAVVSSVVSRKRKSN